MGDRRVIEWPIVDKGREDASLKLVDDAFGKWRGAVSDRVREGAVVSENPSLSKNPYSHVQLAGLALQELDSLSGKSDSDRVRVFGADGRQREVTAGERRKELTETADRSFKTAVALADNIDQTRIPAKLLELRVQMQKTRGLQDLDTLTRTETLLESLKHAPSVVRFAYAMFLADTGDLHAAKDMLDKAAKIDPEAKGDKMFVEAYKALEKGVEEAQVEKANSANPLFTLRLADEKRQRGDIAGAEADYKLAMQQAENVDMKGVATELAEIARLKKESSGDAKALAELTAREEAWTALGHAPAITRINYAEFLVGQNRHREAVPFLIRVGQDDPDLVKGSKEFAELFQTAQSGKEKEPFDNPFDHLRKVEEALKKQDLDGARRGLEAAVRSGDKIDRAQMQENKKVIDEQLKEEKNPDKRKELAEMRNIYDAFDHAAGFARVALARFEVANKNYSAAQTLIAAVENRDAELTTKPEMDFATLKKLAEEPSTWTKVKDFTVGLLKELACDAVAVLAGIGAGLGVGALTSWTGPGLVVAGGAAGAAAGSGAYTFMKCVVFGEEFSWDMPLWGALDGASGGMAAVVRTGLVKVGGKIVSKEMAEAAVLKTGSKVAALEGLEGLKLAHTAEALSKEGLKTMGKNLGMWTRFKSAIPVVNAGNAEYRAALSAYRGLRYTNLGVKMGIDAGTVFTGSLVFRGGKEGYKFATGEHKDFSSFGQAYAAGVLGDTATGATLGAYTMGFKPGLMVSGLRHSAQESLFGDSRGFGDYSRNVLMGMGRDGLVSIPSMLIGDRSGAFARATPAIQRTGDALWIGSSPRWADMQQPYEYLGLVEATVKDLQSPVTGDQIFIRFNNIPGRLRYPER